MKRRAAQPWTIFPRRRQPPRNGRPLVRPRRRAHIALVTHPIVQLLFVGAVVMCLSHTIARERICDPLRRRLGGKDTWLGYLLSCPYCTSHWVAFLLVPLTGTYPVQVAPAWGWLSQLLRWFLSCILVVAVAAFLRVAFYFVDEHQGLARREVRKVEEETETVRTLREAAAGGRPAALR